MSLKTGKGVTMALFDAEELALLDADKYNPFNRDDLKLYDADDVRALESYQRKRIKELKIERQLKSSRNHVKTLYVIISLVILFFFYVKFEDRYWRVELDYGGNVMMVRNSWWGMKHEYQLVRYDEEEGWQFQANNGQWYMLSFGDESI